MLIHRTYLSCTAAVLGLVFSANPVGSQPKPTESAPSRPGPTATDGNESEYGQLPAVPIVPETFPARGRAPYPAPPLTPKMLPKRGPCPNNYQPSGTYCRPKKGALFAVRRVGPCPIGYVAQGAYCIARDWQARYIFVRALLCPAGYSAQGKYCIENRHASNARQ